MKIILWSSEMQMILSLWLWRQLQGLIY